MHLSSNYEQKQKSPQPESEETLPDACYGSSSAHDYDEQQRKEKEKEEFLSFRVHSEAGKEM